MAKKPITKAKPKSRAKPKADHEKRGPKQKWTKAHFKKMLLRSRGNRTKASIRLKCAVSTVTAYIKKWPEMLEVEQMAKEDYVVVCEDQLEAAVRAGNLTAVIFSLKTLEPETYSERQEITGANGNPVEVIIMKEEADL